MGFLKKTLIVLGVLVLVLSFIFMFLIYKYSQKSYQIKVENGITKIYIKEMRCKLDSVKNLICLKDNIMFVKNLDKNLLNNKDLFYIDFCPTDPLNIDFTLLYNNLYILEFGEKKNYLQFSEEELKPSEWAQFTEKLKKQIKYIKKNGKPSEMQLFKDFFFCSMEGKVSPKDFPIIAKNIYIQFNYSNILPPGSEILVNKGKINVEQLIRNNKVKVKIGELLVSNS